MRDERYYQRLNQIRQKYGYQGDANPELQPTRMPQRRGPLPAYHDAYQIPPKPQQNQQAVNLLLEARRAKENNSTPPQHYHREAATERAYRQAQTHTRYPLEKREPPNLPHYPSEFLTTPSSSKDCSPIKRLHIDLPSQNTPLRQYNHSSQRPKATQVASTRNNYRTQAGNTSITDRPAPLPYDAFEETPRNAHGTANHVPLPQRSPARQPRELRNVVQTLYSEKEGEDYSNKYNASLNNIDKLQQRIQAMLNRPKK